MPALPNARRAVLAGASLLVLLGVLTVVGVLVGAPAAGPAVAEDAAPAPAPADTRRILTRVTPADLLGLARLIDPAAEADAERPERVWFALGGQRMTLTDEGGGSISFLHGFDGKGVRPEAPGIWNRERRFARSYVAEDGTMWLQQDVFLRGGVTAEHLAEQTWFWRAVFLGYVEHLARFGLK